MMMRSFLLWLSAALSAAVVESFLPVPSCRRAPSAAATTTARQNFFKDMFGAAFDNDVSLSRDNKLAGMLDEGVEGSDTERAERVKQLTSTQQAWRQKMMPTTVSPADIEGSAITLDLFLTGIPNKDPSNDLFGSKTNISSRDRVVGQVVPTEPTVSGVQVRFQADQRCVVTTVVGANADFCKTGLPGDWKLSDGGGRQIRFRIPVTGFTRTIQTKGTIQKIYWSTQNEQTTQTSTTYSIPEGWLYFDAELVASKAPGKPIQWSDGGVVKVEQSMGLLGAASRMIPCGKFSAKPMTIAPPPLNQKEQEPNQ